MEFIGNIVLIGLIIATGKFFCAKALKKDPYKALLWMIVLGNILVLLKI